jgi:hypothetical protein
LFNHDGTQVVVVVRVGLVGAANRGERRCYSPKTLWVRRKEKEWMED